MVVIRPRSMPKASLSTLARGARQLVVQDALLMIVCEPSYSPSLTPMTIVMSSSVAGAEMMTFLAPPASTCLRASAALVKKPVDSTTTSTPRSAHGRLAGSRSESTFILVPPMVMPSPSATTSCGRRPRMLSYLSRWARASLLVRSLTATISMSWPLAAAARQKLRPMRPNPLMPTRTVTADLHVEFALSRQPGRAQRAASLPQTLAGEPRPGCRSPGRGSHGRNGLRRRCARLAREGVVGGDDPVAAGRLGDVERPVGCLQQRAGGYPVPGSDGDAGTDRDLDALATERVHDGGDTATHLLRPQHRLLAVGSRQQDEELLATEADGGVAVPDRCLQEPGHRGEDGVPGRMPEAVVDRLEVVDVEGDDRQPLVGAL